MADRFKKLNTDEGLPAISSITKDPNGFMWIGTMDGLFRFDGNTFKTYRANIDKPNSLASNTIHKILLDHLGQIWIVTDKGLHLYHRDRDYFERIKIDGLGEETDIRHILQKENHVYWFATYGQGLYLVDLKERRTLENIKPKDQPKLGSRGLFKLHKDRRNKLWIATYDGVTTLDLNTNTYDRINVGMGPRNIIQNVIELENGTIWIVTFDKIYRFDEQTATFIPLEEDRKVNIAVGFENKIIYHTRDGLTFYDTVEKRKNVFSPNPKDDYAIHEDALPTLYINENKELWLGFLKKGIQVWKLNQQFVRRYASNREPEALQDSRVTGVDELPTGELAVYSQKGLDFIDLDERIIKRLPNDIYGLANYKTMRADSHGDLWLGGAQGLKKIQNPLDDKNRVILEHDDIAAGSVQGYVIDIQEDENQTLWIASNKGLFRKSLSEGQFINLFQSRPDLDKYVTNLHMGMEDRLWLVTKNGLECLNRRTLQSQSFVSKKDIAPLRKVNRILETPTGILLATETGLVVFDKNLVHQQTLNQNNILNTDNIRSVETSDDAIWMATDKGIIKLERDFEYATFFSVYDGLQSKSFNEHSLRSRDGDIFFAGSNGLNRFDPETSAPIYTKPTIVISGFTMFNKPVKIDYEDPNATLKKDITHTEALELDYNDSMFGFHFGMLDVWDPPNKSVQYRLEPLQEAWIVTNPKNPVATFTNLPAGKYHLMVRGTLDGKNWSEAPPLQITMTPPPWLSTPAYIFYACIILYLVFLYIRAQNRKLETQRRINREQERVNQRLRQLDKFKDEILANTSHELRTPLNGIIGLADSLRDGSSGEMSESARKDLTSIVDCGKRLNSLINDILDYSKLKNKTLEMHRTQVHFFELTEQVLSISYPLIHNKNIDLINEVPENFATFPADENRLRQILHNLIGNAIKFTHEGFIKISAHEKDNEVAIAISDSGIGIPQDRLEQIFEAFEQADTSAERDFGGTGLGLAITRRLVNLHGGSIKVHSTVGKGTTFTFTLPKQVSEAVNDPNQPINPVEKPQPAALEAPILTPFIEPIIEEQTAPELPKAFTAKGIGHILIVDDEPVNRKVLINYLTPQGYNLTEVGSGPEALELLDKGITFDLILLDIMMPRMSGYDVCRNIRKQHSASELPILFLSAKNQTGDLLEGFYAGANDYLAKPIAKPELLARVSTHLELLDVNRHLEQKVQERTFELQQKNQKITEQKHELIAKQRQLVMQEKMASIGTLTAGIAHEINNPVNFAHGSVQNLVADLYRFKTFFFELAGSDADDEIVEAFNSKMKPLFEHSETIIEGTKRISGIVRELQTFSRMDEAKIKKADLTDGIRSTISLVKSSFSDRVIFDLQLTDHVVMECWPAEMNQVFMNLTVNACQAITYKQNEQGKPNGERLTIRSKVEGTKATLVFKDDGCGIPDHVRDRIFEPFYTTKPVGEGTGLGLSISYEIIQKHKGQLQVESQKGKGTTFIITLPTDLKLQAEEEEEPQAEEYLSQR